MKKKPSNKKPSIKLLKKKAWAAFSLYIRTKASNHGLVQCVTCGAIKPIKQMQAGHYVDGRKNSVLFVEDIVHPQCVKCNVFNAGAKIEYTVYMLDRYGEKKVQEFIKLKQKVKKFTIEELEDIIKTYTEKTKNIGKDNSALFEFYLNN